MDEQTVNLEPVEPTAHPLETPDHSDANELDRIGLAKFLGINNIKEISQQADHLDRLIEWAKSEGAVDRIDIMGMIKGLGARLGDKSIRNMSMYTYLEMERKQIEAKQRRLEAK